MHIIYTTVTITLLTLLILVMLVAGQPTSAQTDFKIEGKQSNLEREYLEELDKWMLRAYEGDRDAQFKVGVLFTNDQFNSPDYEQAVYWYKQSARQGHVLAQYNLGHQYLGGIGVAKNEAEAIQWWLKAAEQGHSLAQFNVGRAYYLGIGLGEDHALSRSWFERAASNGEPKSIEILEQLGWAERGQYTEQAASNDQTSIATTDSVDTQTSPVADKAPLSDNAAADITTTEVSKSPLAIYTNPAVRSVLIAIIDTRDQIEVVEKSTPWSIVTSRTGFPVWVHGDFLSVFDSTATVTGDNVNARSVPIVTNGTVVGRLKRDESFTILDQRKEWYRVLAPARFKAWVKTQELEISALPLEEASSQPASEVVNIQTSNTDTDTDTDTDTNNDNAWLFNQPADSYTLQLASFDNPEEINKFLKRSKFANSPELHRFTARNKDIAWTYFLYGAYTSKEDAEKAKEEISQKRAWVRNVGRLQQNRCVAWKKQIPTPKLLNTYCVN